LKINDHELLNYDKILIDNYCFQYSNNLLYLPFSKINDLKEKTRRSFHEGLNTCRYDTIMMSITFGSITDSEINLVNIYNLTCSFLAMGPITYGRCILIEFNNSLTSGFELLQNNHIAQNKGKTLNS
jgi:hypothetical protein